MSEIIASTYEIIKEIGSGGGGVVFLANHQRLGKKVVLKADKRKITTRPELLRREVDVLKELSYSNIPQVYDFFVENETVYTVMDFIEGESLDKPLKRDEKFSQPQVIKWAKQILEALCYLHSPIHGDPPKGFVHSDIKPANLMRKSNDDIYLIDFNIALAIGEENMVGISAGYASPEHYGLDYSFVGSTTIEDRTVALKENDDATKILIEKQSMVSASTGKRKVIPDVRSDIYSLGATLYHLLSGKRPAADATEVIPLSDKEFSPQIVAIISKAMNPNPDLRYQTAEELLYAFCHLHENDVRSRKCRRNRLVAGISIATLFGFGVLLSFIGLKRIQVRESWLKFAEYSQNSLLEGDIVGALDCVLQAFPEKKGIFTPSYVPEAQRMLADILGVYDLSDGFKSFKTVELPSAPFCMVIAPSGKSAACIYAGSVAVFDTETAEFMAVMPAENSALSEIQYLDEDIIVYAGDIGITAYNLKEKRTLWIGKPATAISISEDKTTIAAVYKEESFATIYNAETGEVKYELDFKDKHQQVTRNDIFANPNDNIFELNVDGSLLGVSFDDGSLQIYDLINPDADIEIFDGTSGYTHFEGGFYRQYFAFSATNSTESAFAVIDAVNVEQTGGFISDGYFGVQADANGIYVCTDNILVKLHPITGEQTPLVNTAENIIGFARSKLHTLIASQNGILFFNEDAHFISTNQKGERSDFIQISEGIALAGNMNSPVICIMKYENHAETEIFSYAPSYKHDEARLSADGRTVMLFDYNKFRIYDMGQNLVNETEIPDSEYVYDQQFIRDGEESYLEVIYNDGTIAVYSAKDGTMLEKRKGEVPDTTLYEEFVTDTLRIESPLHGTSKAYDRKTGKLIKELNEDAYLTYVTQAGGYIIVQYVSTDGEYYGKLLNQKCEVLAYLPYLCDVIGETLIFDYPTGNMRGTRIYNIDELIAIAKNKLRTGGL